MPLCPTAVPADGCGLQAAVGRQGLDAVLRRGGARPGRLPAAGDAASTAAATAAQQQQQSYLQQAACKCRRDRRIALFPRYKSMRRQTSECGKLTASRVNSAQTSILVFPFT